MNTTTQPNAVVEKIKYWNKLDEAYGFLCLSISKDILFHIMGLKTPKEIWDHLASLFDKQDDLQIYQLDNEMISLNPGKYETMNVFFTKFKHLVLQLKQCKVEKDDDQLILAIPQNLVWIFSLCFKIPYWEAYNPKLENGFS